MSVTDLMCQIAELSMQVQELERVVEDQQDKIGKLRVEWHTLFVLCDKGLCDSGCECAWCAVERAIRELEK